MAISQNFERPVDAALVRKAYVQAGKPLTAKVVELTEPSVTSALERNVDLASKSDRPGSTVVALIQYAEAKASNVKTHAAAEYYLLALVEAARPGGAIASHAKMLKGSGLLIAKARSGNQQ